MRITMLTIIALVMANQVFSSDRSRLDSLKNALPNTTGNSRVDCLNSISTLYIGVRDDSAYVYARRAVDEVRKLNYPAGLADSYISLSSAVASVGTDFPLLERCSAMAVSASKAINDKKRYNQAISISALAAWAQGKFDEAVAFANESVRLSEELNDVVLLEQLYIWMGSMEEQRGNYEKSIQSVKNAYRIEMDNGFEEAYRYSLLGDLYFSFGDYESALKNFRLGIHEVPNDLHQWIGMGKSYYNLKQYDSAMRWYEKMGSNYASRVVANDSIDNDSIHRWLRSRMGEVYMALGEFATAEEYLKSSLKAFEDAQDINQVMRILQHLGETYFKSGQFDLALSSGNKLLGLATGKGARQYVRDANYLLYRALKKSGMNQSAYEHLEKYLELKQLLDEELSAKNLYLLETSIELTNAQSRIDLQQEEILRATEEKRYFIIGAALIGLIGVGLFRNVVLKRKNETQLRMLAEHELANQLYVAAKTKAELMQKATELEMRALRAQMNPHFIFNSLNSINRFILKNNLDEASQFLTKFSKLVRSILQNSMVPLIELENELDSLRLYLELEALRFNHRFSFNISISDDVDIRATKVPPLLIQPFAENAIWHGLMQKSEHGNLNIDIRLGEEHLLIKIADDGIGRVRAQEIKSKSATKEKSLGMKITAERIARLEPFTRKEAAIAINDLTHSDGSPAGTEVTIQIPLMYD